jgi:hypothetical protein
MHVVETTLTKKVLRFMLEKHRSGHLVTRETLGRKLPEITTSLNILQQDFRTIEFGSKVYVSQSVNPLSENYISFEAFHRLPAKVNGLPAPFNLSAPKMYLKRII